MASGLAALALLLAVAAFWAMRAPIHGAVIAEGRVEPALGRQPVQHPEGGQVRAVLVTEGAQVAAGQPLLLLDDALLRPEGDLLAAQHRDLAALRARLLAERDGITLVFEPSDNPATRNAQDEQARLLAARRDADSQTTARLHARIAQADTRIATLRTESAALTRQQLLIARELADQQSLLARGLAQSSRVLALEREAAALEGRQAEVAATIAAAESAASDARLEIAERGATRRVEAAAALRDLDLTLAELAARQDLLDHRRAALTLRAPAAGRILALQITRAPGLLRPGEPALFVLPSDAQPIIAAHAAPDAITRIALGQPALLRLTGHDQRLTPELTGHVTGISADTLTAPATGAAFFRLEITPDLPLPDGITLTPGLPVEVFLATATATPAQILLEPLLAYFRRALRDR